MTVPFVRYMAVHNMTSLKRFHIGKVYIKDNSQMSKGRFREFYQSYFDTSGSNYGIMIPDAEVLKVVVEILTQLSIGGFDIKINHRKLLDAIIQVSGIPKDKFKSVFSFIDQLDKEEWKVVKEEIIQKEISEEQAEKLWSFAQMKNKPSVLLEKLKLNKELQENEAKIH